MNETTDLMLKLEQQFLAMIKDMTLAELSDKFEQPLENLTAMIDLTILLKNSCIKFMFSKEEFLNLPIKAHYTYGQNADKTDIFLITRYPKYKQYVPDNRAIRVRNGYCELVYCAEMPEHEIPDSQYRTVRDILSLICFETE